MKAKEIRQTFIDFFKGKGHKIVPSSPVLPQGDQTILFTNAGMNQFKDVFCGRETRSYRRAVSYQKCIRAGGKHNDLDNVGHTARHLTFFEMLGNFSFGDYFKEKAIEWSWELLTGPYGLDPNRLYITVYHNDGEARKIWNQKIGVPEERIFGLGDKDNFWSMGNIGPCGPCSEILYDRGKEFSCGDNCGIGRCECDRYFEIWNLVFMQYNQAADGTRAPLPRPSIDTGMGLERLCLILQGVQSVYETDLLSPIVQKVVDLSGIKYSEGQKGIPHRVVADHIRSIFFSLADGAYPSNEGRGYVVRRILRRASRYGRIIELKKPFLYSLVDTLEKLMHNAFPEITERKEEISRLIKTEEERFGLTMEQGLELFAQTKKELEQAGHKKIPGKKIFLMHDTFGFPPDLIQRMAEEEGLQTDMAEYEKLMTMQKKRSRARAKFSDTLAADPNLEGIPATVFTGYDTFSLYSEILAWSYTEDGKIIVVLSQTPFYAESGGQVGDMGIIENSGFSVHVEDTQKRGEHVLHIGRFEGNRDLLKKGIPVLAELDFSRRKATQRNHTATHLLHAALRSELGSHVEQRGSLVTPDRLRFDFIHGSGLSREEIKKVEIDVNNAIVANASLTTTIIDKKTAQKRGAMALFGEKYGDKVRMVEIKGFSIELCGGTHVEHTGEIGLFKIISESSTAAGIRRIEAVTGPKAFDIWHETEEILTNCAQALKTSPKLLLQKITNLKDDLRKLQKKKQSSGPVELQQSERKFGSITAMWKVMSDCSIPELRMEWDRLKNKLSNTVLILLGKSDSSLGIFICLSPDLKGKTNVHCGLLAKSGGKAMGAGGGGRPDMGQAGGKEPGKTSEVLAVILKELEKQITAIP